MPLLKRHPLFVSVLLLLAVVFATQIWLTYELAADAGRKGQSLQRKAQEWRSLRAAEPSATAESSAAIEADLAQSTRALEAARSLLRGGAAHAALREARVPATRTDAYFDLATFVEKMRALALESGVGIGANERFGFAAYQSEGPEAGLIPVVFRQRVAAEFLLEALMAARPLQLVSLEREAPEASGRAGAASPGRDRSGGGSGEIFAIDPRLSERVPGAVRTLAFRVTFVGQTPALRAFVNRLASFEMPVVVRAVEVEPAGAAAEDPAVKPLVPRSLSKFTVSVEWVELEASAS